MSLDITNKVFQQNVPAELDQKRNDFCPAKGKATCNRECPIWVKYHTKGLSCNGALSKYPDDCIKIMEG